MMSIDTVFSGINFSIFLLLMGYLFKQYGLKVVRAHINHKRELRQSLLDRSAELFSKQKQLDLSIQDQEKSSKDLHAKVIRWCLAFEQNVQRTEEQRKALYEQLELKRRQQADNWYVQRVENRVMAEAVTQAHRELVAVFENEKAGYAYNHRIIEQLHKR
jgi:hypothetical protein